MVLPANRSAWHPNNVCLAPSVLQETNLPRHFVDGRFFTVGPDLASMDILVRTRSSRLPCGTHTARVHRIAVGLSFRSLVIDCVLAMVAGFGQASKMEVYGAGRCRNRSKN